MKRILILVIGFLTVMPLFLAACAPTAAPALSPVPAPVTAPVAPASATPTKAAWEIEWERVLTEAKKEGRVRLTCTLSGETRGALVKAFKEAYGINLEAIAGRTTEIHTKVLAERRVGLYLWDVGMAGSTAPYTDLEPAGALVPLDPALIVPDVTDPQLIKKIWYRGELWWIDPDHYLLATQMFPYPPLAVNTDLVKPEEIKSYNDLLDPKWKGKMIFDDPTITGSTLPSFLNHTFGPEWLRRLAKQEPIIMRDQRLEIDWLARGKAPILIAPRQEQYFLFKRIGAPVQAITPKEGSWLSAGSSTIRIFDRPANPNAAKVFINWFLSKEGQTIFSQLQGAQSTREDVPTDFLEPEATRQPGVKYWEKDRIEIIRKRGAEEIKLFKDIFGPLVK